VNVERHIRRLNRLLLAELGENPPYQWVYSESVEFLRPMRAMDEDGNLKWDYVCPCGKNVRVHNASCSPSVLTPHYDEDDEAVVTWSMDLAKTSSLIVATPVWEMRKTDISLDNQWVLCCKQFPMSEHAWGQVFGSVLPYPKNGSWAPVATETRTVAMAPECLPGKNFTMACIRGRQLSREISAADIDNATQSRMEHQDRKRRENIHERLTDVLPVNPNPGKRGGGVSWGGVRDVLVDPAAQVSAELAQKIDRGESLVSL
jgi:hypothetical protein